MKTRNAYESTKDLRKAGAMYSVSTKALHSHRNMVSGQLLQAERFQIFTVLRKCIGRPYILEKRWVKPRPWDQKFEIDLTEYVVPILTVQVDKETGIPLTPRKHFSLKNDLKSKTKAVLVTGDVGSGKSTFCTKLAHDWAKKSLCRRVNKKSYLLINFPVSEFKSNQPFLDSLVEHISSLTLINVEDIREYVKNNFCAFPKLVILLDGYDEMETEKQELLREFIEDVYTKHKRFLVIVTSRDTSDECFLSLFKARYQIEGITRRGALQFTDKFFICDKNEKDAFIKLVDEYYKWSDETVSPLLLFYLCNALCPVFENQVMKEESPIVNFVTDLVKRCNAREDYNLTEEEIFTVTRRIVSWLSQQKPAMEYTEDDMKRILSNYHEIPVKCGILKPTATTKTSYVFKNSLILDLVPVHFHYEKKKSPATVDSLLSACRHSWQILVYVIQPPSGSAMGNASPCMIL